MKILHISTSDKSGGASMAAFRLHNAMLSSDIDSKYLVLDRVVYDRIDIVSISKYSRYIKKIINIIFEMIMIRNMHGMKGLFSSFKYGANISQRSEVVEADVIYLHWINIFVNYQELKKLLKTGKPVFWFMHDMFAITGGCHHSFECSNYQTQCRKCPYHKGVLSIDLSVRQYNIKKKIYKQFTNLMFVAPSKWLFDCAQKSGLTQGKRIYHIPNMIDVSVFKPFDKNIMRKLLSLDSNSNIIGFGAESALVNPYKGWDYFKSALQMLSTDSALQNTKIEVLVFGSSYSKEVADAVPFPVHFLGHLYDEVSLVVFYNCIDVFVIPSLAEAFGQTVIESLSCDTPVVGFNVGGISDMVNKKTGYLAAYKSSDDLAKGISLMLRAKKKNVSDNINPFLLEEVLKKHKEMWNTEGI